MQKLIFKGCKTLDRLSDASRGKTSQHPRSKARPWALGHSSTPATSWEKGKFIHPSYIYFGHLVCHWKAKLRLRGFFFFFFWSFLCKRGMQGWQHCRGRSREEDGRMCSHPLAQEERVGLQTKLKHLLGWKWEMFFFFVVFSDLPYVFSYLFITLSIISRSTYPTNDAWKFQHNKSKGANLAAPHLNARLPSSSVTTQTPLFVRSSHFSWKWFWKPGN